MKNLVHLITYPDSLGGNLSALGRVLDLYFPHTFSGIHLLPPYPSTGDRGFAPVTYQEIEPRFGSWEDIHTLAENHTVMLDFMVNHVSRHSAAFQDFLMHGRASAYADLFITLEKIWPDGKPVEEDIKKIFLRRPHHPFLEVPIQDGSTQTVWATFGQADWSDQIDIDVRSPAGQDFIKSTLSFLARQGVHTLRLDAAAFVIKRAGTSCFLVEPEVSEFFAWIHEQARQSGINLLLEIHTEPLVQAQLAARGYWVYNFVLPLLVLHTLVNRSSSALKAHLRGCPRSQITMLDCHDGIPVQPDIEGVLEVECAQRIVRLCEERGANISRIYSSQHKGQGGFDAHQINCTYYSALGCDDDAYILARALQFFSPGTPQVYYVGLLAGENAPREVEIQADRRAINRANYSEEEIKTALQKPVVHRLLKLISFRNEHPAFNGEFECRACSDGELCLTWKLEAQEATLKVDLVTQHCAILYTDPGGQRLEYNP